MELYSTVIGNPTHSALSKGEGMTEENKDITVGDILAG
jgi:hypothetical protein